MKEILVDLNIILDVLLDRDPFEKEAALLWSLVESEKLSAYISATSVTNLFYILHRMIGVKKAKSIIVDVLDVFQVAGVNQAVIVDAIHLPYSDFEDAVQESCARFSKLEAIITRNKKDFKRSNIPVYTASEFLAILQYSQKYNKHLQLYII